MEENKAKCETCFFCGQVYKENDLVELDGKRICPECLASETRICSHCGERIWNVNNQGTLSMPLCQECYRDKT